MPQRCLSVNHDNCIAIKVSAQATIMPTSLRQFEYIMGLVIEWANDVPFENWFQLMKETYDLDELDTAPDYQITLVNGKPYLYDPLLGGRRPSWNTSEKSSWTDHPWRSPSWNTSEKSSLDGMD